MDVVQYITKKVIFDDETKSILTQNLNGPCPLLALANLLVLENSLFIHPDYSSIDHNNLVSMIADALFERSDKVKSI